MKNGFVADIEQLVCQNNCINTDIIISPKPTGKGMYPEEWRIAVSFMPNYKKIYLTPTVYITDNVWSETFKLMKFYYDKKNE